MKILKYAGAILIAIMLFAFMLLMKKPAYIIAGVRIENIDAPEAKTKIENIVKEFSGAGKLKFSDGNKEVFIAPGAIDAKWNINKTIKDLKKYRNLRLTPDPIAAPVYADFDKGKLLAEIKNAYKNEIKDMQPAKIIFSGGTFKISEEQEGAFLEEETLIKITENRLTGLSEETAPIYLKKIAPPITAGDLAVYFDEITTILKKPIKTQYGFLTFTFLPQNHLGAIGYKKEYGLKNGEKIKISLDAETIKKTFTTQIAQAINKKTSPIKIYQNANGKIIFEGKAEAGEDVNEEQMIQLIEIAMNESIPTVKIPVIETPPAVSASEDLQNLGIKELIGVGHTSFYGSPQNRNHNIRLGTAKFNGVIIGPGEEFSFNKTLGRVDASTGYKEELVIKPEGTIPEYGGGLCQVSTTMYRAAIYSGLPITERFAHSYAVTYYSQIGGHGLDATIYPGARDLKFKNDTQVSILIQAYVEGMEAFYKFYGTKNGRKIEVNGPYLSNFKSAGGTEITKTTKLRLGEKKQIEKAGKGFDAVWDRIITYGNGEEKRERIFSSYRATSNKFLEGTVSGLEETIQPQPGETLPPKELID